MKKKKLWIALLVAFVVLAAVKQISDKNKQTYTGSRDDLISQGYAPARNAICKQKRATDPHQK